jgi:hypothetical protein
VFQTQICKPDLAENTLKMEFSIIAARKMILDMKFGLHFSALKDERGITTTNKNYLAVHS